jgi:transcriptional regulator with XRE-family HTH domain
MVSDTSFNRIAELRLENKLQRPEVAKYIGTSERTLANMELGRNDAEFIHRIAKLCKHLGCKLEDFCEKRPEPDATGSKLKFQASKIAEYRKKCDLTQLELAELIGVKKITLLQWENEKRGVDSIRKLIRLCELLKCDIQDLVQPCSLDSQQRQKVIDWLISRDLWDLKTELTPLKDYIQHEYGIEFDSVDDYYKLFTDAHQQRRSLNLPPAHQTEQSPILPSPPDQAAKQITDKITS